MGFGSGEPNNIEIPGNMLNFIENRNFFVLFIFDIFLLEQKIFFADFNGYTLLSIENNSGDEIFLIKCFLESLVAIEYIIKIEFYINGVAASSTLFQIPIKNIKSRNKIKLTFLKMKTDFYEIVFNFYNFEVSKGGSKKVSLNLSISGNWIIVLGHKKAPFSNSSLAFFSFYFTL